MAQVRFDWLAEEWGLVQYRAVLPYLVVIYPVLLRPRFSTCLATGVWELAPRLLFAYMPLHYAALMV